MPAKSYTLNNGVSMPAIGQHDPGCVAITSSSFETTAFGGWGGYTDKDRERYGPTLGLALKVGASSSLLRQTLNHVFQEGYRHIDGAWWHRTLYGIQLVSLVGDLQTQRRRSRQANRSASPGFRGRSCLSLQSFRKH